MFPLERVSRSAPFFFAPLSVVRPPLPVTRCPQSVEAALECTESNGMRATGSGPRQSDDGNRMGVAKF